MTVLKVLDLYNQYGSYNKVANICNLHRQTVTNWVKSYKFNLIKLKKRIYANKDYNNVIHNFSIVNNDILDFIKKIIYENPFLTKNEIKQFIKKQFNLSLSNKKINKIFKHLNFSKKKPKKYIVKSAEYIDTLSKLRDDFLNKIKKENIDKIISIDETGLQNFINNYIMGYSPKGESISIPSTQLSFKNQTILFAITTEKIISYDIFNENVNTDLYYNFIKKTIECLTSKNYIFIFDNVSFHNSEKVLKLINDSGHKYIFVPPYSPNLNPIENVNSILKDKIKKIKMNEIIDDNIKIKTKTEIKNKLNENKLFIDNKIKIEIKDNKDSYKDKKINKDEYLNKKQKIKIDNKKLKKILQIEIRDNNITKINRYIIKAINDFNNEYSKDKILLIFNHAFKYSYKNIEKELRDRIKFIK